MAEIPQHTLYTRKFLMVLASDSKTGATGLTPTVLISKSGASGAFAVPIGTVSELSSGWYQIILTAADTDTAGDMAYEITGTGADATSFTDQVKTLNAIATSQRGTTDSSTLTRNQLITEALTNINALEGGELASPYQMGQGISTLNQLIREEDAIGANLWAHAPDPASISLQQHVGNYGPTDGLPTNVARLMHAVYRDPSGRDWPLDILTQRQYAAIPFKTETGQPRSIFLTQNRQLSLRELRVHPLPNLVSAGSVVVGTDSNNVKCIRSHTSLANNQPKTGANWRLFWADGGTGPTTWTVNTAYTAAPVIRLTYGRPLYDFNQANDDPDMPPSLTRVLRLRLQRDLADPYAIPIEDRNELNAQITRAKLATFRHVQQEETTSLHNKATYM